MLRISYGIYSYGNIRTYLIHKTIFTVAEVYEPNVKNIKYFF